MEVRLPVVEPVHEVLAVRAALRYRNAVEPRKPAHPDPFAAAFLTRLQDLPEAEQFVLGGYFALKHYLDYRATGDVDAWWRSREDPRALAVAREAFARTAEQFGYAVRERGWGETISLEAIDGSDKAFSFQVSVRSVEIDRPIASPWGRFPIETLDDNIASKMMALVARGAPRDFVDVKEVVDAGLLSAERCWELWAAKDPGMEPDEGRARVRIHLERIETRMPIERLPPDRRARAAALRAWYRDDFTSPRAHGLPGEDRRDGEERGW